MVELLEQISEKHVNYSASEIWVKQIGLKNKDKSNTIKENFDTKIYNGLKGKQLHKKSQ